MRAGRGVWREEAADGKTVWSWHPLLVSSRRRFVKPNREMRAANSPATEAKGIRLRGDRGISRKTIAQGRPGVPAHLRSAVCIFAHDCGCHGHPAFPAPLLSRGQRQCIISGAPRREIAMSYPAAGRIYRKQLRAGSPDLALPAGRSAQMAPRGPAGRPGLELDQIRLIRAIRRLYPDAGPPPGQ